LQIIVRNQTSGEVLGDQVTRALSSAERRQGLLKHTTLNPGQGLWIDPCEGVHSFFMKFAIDVIYLDKSKKVTKIRAAMKPWRLSLSLFSRSVLELPAGTAQRTRTQAGDQLSFVKVSTAAIVLIALSFTACAKRQTAVFHAPVTSFDRQVRNAVDAGDGDFQLARLREKVIASPTDVSSRLQLGAAYEAKGYPELALDHYRMAGTQSPDAPEPQLHLARALVSAHHPEQGIAAYASFIGQHPNLTPLYFAWLGILQDEAGDWKSGEASHRAASERARTLGQDQDYLHNNLGYCLQVQGRTEEARAEYRQALNLNPQSEIARDNLAATLTHGPGADRAEAVVNFQSVGEPAAAHSNMAALLIEQGNYLEARLEVDRALSYNRAYPAALRNLKILSELDGKPAIIAFSPAAQSRLDRLKLAVHRFFQGPVNAVPNPQPNVPAETASRKMESPQ
jgi:tetratricopeptide (TPR) repeat protein/uncharacterized membrane protein (UPF0127 family)